MATAENKRVVEKVNEAFNNNNIEDFLNYCAEDIIWSMPGYETFKGLQSLREFMLKGPSEAPLFTVKNIIAENQFVVCNGEMKMKNKEGAPEDFVFCDMYNIESGKIIELTSYIIKLKK